ncbi:hypothetical protein WS105_0607 [Weissella ceti]|uniref:phage tail spike protein n=1 Tax=Weissella ceti TaxID=759620 RepID=UPI0004F8D9AA|nr:phage tail spike protein [Weissella ceti]AIM64197.1 hypothetical protein WS105_0607 [Weissella ceti]
MTPILFDSTAIDFNTNGLGTLPELYDVDIEEQRNGLFQLSARYPTSGVRYEDISEGKIILAKPNPTGDLHAFRIVVSEINTSGHYLDIEADSITYDLAKNLVKNVSLEGDGETVMRMLEKATMHKHLFSLYSDIKHVSRTTFEYVNPMEAIAGVQGSFLQLWGGEMKRENRKVSMLTRRGRDNVTSFRLGKNIKGLKYSVDTGSLVTQIVPTVTVQSGNKDRFIEGKTVTSQFVNNYPIIYTHNVDVSEHVSFPEDASDAVIKKKIDEYAADWFTKSQNTGKDKPKVSIDIDVLSLQDSSNYQDKFKDLETVELTDTVTVYVPEYKINVTAIVNELHYDPIQERVTKLVVGVAKMSFASANKNKLDEMNNKITQVQRDAIDAARSADGKSTNYYGRSKPTHPQAGDLWYWTDGVDSGIRIFENGQWVDLVDTKTEKRIDSAVDDAKKAAKDYTDKLNQENREKTDEAIKEVQDGLDEVQPKIDEAKDSVLNDVNKAIGVVDVKVNSITSIVNNPSTGLQATRVQLDNAIQQEIKNRITGDSNTLTQANNFTSSQIQSSETGMKSALTQTSDSIMATINALNQVVDSSLVSGLDLWRDTNINDETQATSKWFLSAENSYEGTPSMGINTKGEGNAYYYKSSQLIPVTAFSSRTVYTSVDIKPISFGDPTNSYMHIYFNEYDKNGKYIPGTNTSISGVMNANSTNFLGKWSQRRKTIALNADTVWVKIRYQMRGDGEAYVARPYIGSSELPVGSYVAGPVSNTSTQLQLFKDNFALGIKDNTGELISGINGDTSGLVIAGKKLVINSDTTVTGDFYAKGGNFKNLNASNMTAGTLNAATVNLINLNASNITTGIIRGPNLDINLNNGLVTFQKGRLYSTTGTIDMNIDQGYLSVANNNTSTGNNVLIRNGEIAFTQPNIFDPSKDPYLRISNTFVGSSFASGALQAKYGFELNVKGYESSIVDMGVQSLAGIKFGKGNSGNLEKTLVGGGNQGVKISGGSATTGMLKSSPSIYVGSNQGGDKAGNRVLVQAEFFNSQPTYAKTSSNGANVYVASDGALVRSTSARKYKTNIKHDVPIVDSEKLLDVPLSTWDDIAELKTTGKSDRYFGMIAEDLADVGLDYLVTHGDDGQIEGIEYARVALLLVPLVKQLQQEINELKKDKETA